MAKVTPTPVRQPRPDVARLSAATFLRLLPAVRPAFPGERNGVGSRPPSR